MQSVFYNLWLEDIEFLLFTFNTPLDWSTEMLLVFQKTSSMLTEVNVTWFKLYMYYFFRLSQSSWELAIYSFFQW